MAQGYLFALGSCKSSSIGSITDPSLFLFRAHVQGEMLSHACVCIRVGPTYCHLSLSLLSIFDLLMVGLP